MEGENIIMANNENLWFTHNCIVKKATLEYFTEYFQGEEGTNKLIECSSLCCDECHTETIFHVPVLLGPLTQKWKFSPKQERINFWNNMLCKEKI